MSNCPGTDALATIAGALDWDVENGIRHLNTCDECGVQLRSLATLRASYEGHETVSPDLVTRISAALSEQAARERERARKASHVGDVVESLLAGATALAVLNTGELNVSGALNAIVFAVVATSLFAYRMIRSSHSTAVRSSLPSIQ